MELTISSDISVRKPEKMLIFSFKKNSIKNNELTPYHPSKRAKILKRHYELTYLVSLKISIKIAICVFQKIFQLCLNFQTYCHIVIHNFGLLYF